MMCTSSGLRATFFSASTTGMPMVRFGTKWPSMTSTCSQSAPASSTLRTSSARRTKSADSSEGAILTGGATEESSQPSPAIASRSDFERLDPGQFLPLEQFQRCAAARRDVLDLVGQLELRDGRGAVAAANDSVALA